jgi:hypothetical protein
MNTRGISNGLEMVFKRPPRDIRGIRGRDTRQRCRTLRAAADHPGRLGLVLPELQPWPRRLLGKQTSRLKR